MKKLSVSVLNELSAKLQSRFIGLLPAEDIDLFVRCVIHGVEEVLEEQEKEPPSGCVVTATQLSTVIEFFESDRAGVVESNVWEDLPDRAQLAEALKQWRSAVHPEMRWRRRPGQRKQSMKFAYVDLILRWKDSTGNWVTKYARTDEPKSPIYHAVHDVLRAYGYAKIDGSERTGFFAAIDYAMTEEALFRVEQ